MLPSEQIDMSLQTYKHHLRPMVEGFSGGPIFRGVDIRGRADLGQPLESFGHNGGPVIAAQAPRPGEAFLEVEREARERELMRLEKATSELDNESIPI